MCEFCTKHGEGKKWYLNAKNYSDDLLSDIRRRKLAKNVFYRIDKMYRTYFNLYRSIPNNIPIISSVKNMIVKKIFRYQHWGQIIPIEDVESILSMASSIVRLPCICRKVTTGKEIRACFVIVMSPVSLGMVDIIDKSYFSDSTATQFEKINKNDALDFMKKQELNGMVHSVWTHGTPFIGGICSCDDTGCLGMKMYREATQVFFRGEYVAEIDKNECIGCRKCVEICLFKAINFDIVNKKAEVNAKMCYGCGICRATCKKNAIKLASREKNILASNIWC